MVSDIKRQKQDWILLNKHPKCSVMRIYTQPSYLSAEGITT